MVRNWRRLVYRTVIAWIVHTFIASTLMLASASESLRFDANGDGKGDMLFRHTSDLTWQLNLMSGLSVESSNDMSDMSSCCGWLFNGTGDFNGDGNDDVIIRNVKSGDWYIYNLDGANIINRGYANIRSAVDYAVQAVADFNQDGKSDIILRNEKTGEWSIALMDNREVISETALDMSKVLTWKIVDARDFDGNGSPDVLIRNSASGLFYLYLYEQTSVVKRGYMPSITSDLEDEVKSVADFDGDGKSDILFRNLVTNGWTIFSLNGLEEAQSSRLPLVTAGNWNFLDSNDFDGNGYSDIAVLNLNDGEIYVYLSENLNVTNKRSVAYVENGYAAASLISNSNANLSDIDVELNNIDYLQVMYNASDATAPLLEVESQALNLDAGQQYAFDLTTNSAQVANGQLSVEEVPDFLDVEIDSSQLTIAVQALSSVQENTIWLRLKDGSSSAYTEIPVTISGFPVTNTGLGKTLKGSASGKGVHLVIMGDGYTSEELGEYQTSALEFVDLMSGDPGVDTHFSAWNIHVVTTASNESGSDATFGEDTVDTAFGSGYNCSNIQRLLCADTSAVFTAALAEFPHLDEIILVVNDAQYGGSGGSIAVYSKDAPEIALHELGHSFAGLADEYWYSGSTYSGTDYSQINVSSYSDPEQVPWSHWIEDMSNIPSGENETGVGMFEGGYYNEFGIYRPTFNSRMRSNFVDFGPVNSEQWAIKVYETAGAFEEVSPESADLFVAANESVELSIDPLFFNNIQQLKWFVNGDAISSANGSGTYMFSSDTAGEYMVTVTLTDISGLVLRTDSHAANTSHTWLVTVQ